MHAVTTHVIAWAPSPSSFPSGYVSGFEQYLADMQHDLGHNTNISSVASQYLDANGPALSSLTNDGVITDSDPYPASDCTLVPGATNCLSESAIWSEVGSLITNDGLSTDVNQTYIVLLPQNVDSCAPGAGCNDSDYCGYHDYLPAGSSYVPFTLLPYTESSFNLGDCSESPGTYPGANSSTTAGYALDNIGAHELLESATDPTGDGYRENSGLPIGGNEIGDECAWTYGSPTPATGGGYYNQLVNGHQYLIQEMWSNQDNNCVQGDAPPATASITPSASPTTTSPTSFTVALHNDANPASSYEWSYLTPGGQLHQDVSSSAAPSISLTTRGPNTVWVQINDSAGGTITEVTSVDVIGAPPSASFVYSSNATWITPHNPVGFTSNSSSDSSEQITASWDFGDGATATGPVVSHSYAAPGKYTVTLTVTQTDGQTAHTSQVVSVDGPPTAAFTVSPNPITNASTAFSSVGSSAAAGSIMAYSWNFGDGGVSTQADPTHTYAAAGNFTVSLTVTQSDGQTATVGQTLSVAASFSSSPLAGAARASLAQGLLPPRRTLRIATLLRKGGATSVISKPSQSGRVSITWYVTVKHHRIVVARGSGHVSAGVRAHIAIRLTAAGRRLLRTARKLTITVSGVYAFAGGVVTVKRVLTLRH